MNIDLIYLYRPYSSNYYLYGPEKVNNNIVANPDGVLVFSSESAVFNKIDEMCSSLSPEITNINIKSSVEFTGGFKMRIYTGEINVDSDVPDYTNILTSINTNLTNISNNLQSSSNSNSNTGIATILSNIFQYDNGYSSMRLNLVSSAYAKNKSNLINMLLQIVNCFANNINVVDDAVLMPESKKYLSQILSSLKQSISPNATITDVISALNTNIHNDLTDINTTTNNKDTVLIVDGQQDFVIRKQNNDDYDS